MLYDTTMFVNRYEIYDEMNALRKRRPVRTFSTASFPPHHLVTKR